MMKVSADGAEKKPEETRQRILQAGFEEMYENGYQGMRIDAILKKTGLAKGALYHHFPNKKSLGYAVVEEVIVDLDTQFLDLLTSIEDPIEANCELLRRVCAFTTLDDIHHGCPANNLSQEMAGLDEGFKQRLSSIYEMRVNAIQDSLERGKRMGCVRSDLDTYNVAGFIISSYNGIVGAGKCTGDIELFRSLVSTLIDYVTSLRD